MIQRDYIERLIQQAIQGLAQVVALVRRGELDPALILVDKTADLLLGSLRAAFERLDAPSAVALVGPGELERVRLYAALVSEQAAIHELRGNGALALFLQRRSRDFYRAAQGAGCRLLPDDLERLADLDARLHGDGEVPGPANEDLRPGAPS